MNADAPSRDRLIQITLDEKSLVRRKAEVEHERAVAIYDLLEENYFALRDGKQGPYILRISLVDQHLMLDLQAEDEQPLDQIRLPLSPYRSIIKDYFTVCETYYDAIRTATPQRIEAIDMGRRGLHDEGSKLLQERLSDRVEMDMQTARRLFTLVCVLHLRG